MAKRGYARVSTHQQSLDIQISRLLKEGVRKDRICTDIASGKNADDRKGLQQLILKAEAGDVVLVTKMDRLGRNTLDMVSLVEDFSSRDVVVRFLDDGLDTSGETGKLIITILAAVAQAERARILERTNEGREAAKERGVRFGRPSEVDNEKFIQLWEQDASIKAITEKLSISRQYVYKLRDKLGLKARTQTNTK
jgi:DNA invertase Pin-like site-specific DNA recombinase